MIILITGASHTGKTLLAQRLLEKYIEDHFDEIIGHESEIESRLIEADCTIDDLKQWRALQKYGKECITAKCICSSRIQI